MGMGDKTCGQPGKPWARLPGLLAERQRHGQVGTFEDVASIGQEALQQALEAGRGGGKGGAEEVRDALGDLLGDDQGLHSNIPFTGSRLFA